MSPWSWQWCSKAFQNVNVVPPDVGAVHQVNLEHLCRVVHVSDGLVYPDSVVGTDSHTTMINGLGVLGWGETRRHTASPPKPKIPTQFWIDFIMDFKSPPPLYNDVQLTVAGTLLNRYQCEGEILNIYFIK